MSTQTSQRHETSPDRDRRDRGGPRRCADLPHEIGTLTLSARCPTTSAQLDGSARSSIAACSTAGADRPQAPPVRPRPATPLVDDSADDTFLRLHDSRQRRGQPPATLVNYNYGSLSVSVTASGTKITNVGIASLDDGGNFRSQSIDQQSIPILEQQALQAQSAQHPRGLRCELHERRLRAVAAVGPQQARPLSDLRRAALAVIAAHRAPRGARHGHRGDHRRLRRRGRAGSRGYAALAQARAILQRADAVFSTWKADSPMSRLRRGEITLEEAPTEVADGLGALRDGPRDLRRVVRSLGDAGRSRPDGPT